MIRLGICSKGVSALHEQLQQNTAQVLAITAKQVVHGLGGVGKTRLAVEYAWRYADEYSAILFVNAESPSALQQNLAALCDAKYLNLLEQQATEQDLRTAAVLRWLSEHAGWLLIMDNIDSPAAAKAVEALFSQLQAGQVLLTSRLADWGGDVQAMPLDVLAESDAVDFILERTQPRRIQQPTDTADALALVKELGGLALALEQAGAFIAQKRCSISEYLERWKKRETKVRAWYDERLMHYPSSVAVTWDTSVQQLDAAALALLQILCWFAPDPIPRTLLAASAGEQQLTECMTLLSDKQTAASQPDLEDALAQLAAYSLVRWEVNNSAFSLHRLVADITQSRIPEAQRATWLSSALQWINDYLTGDLPPNDVRSWPKWLPLASHLSGLLVLAYTANISDPTARLANDLGLLFYTQGNWAEAESLIRRALAIYEASFGEAHPNVATGLNNLAQLLQNTNRLVEAEPLMRRALAIDEASFGEGHPNVATVLNNLAQLLQDTNRLAEAEPLMRRALTIAESSFGEAHPKVAVSLNNLALLLMTTNRLVEAEPLMRRALAIDEDSFGEAHPNVARKLNNLALLLKDTKRLAEAEPLMRNSLEIFLQFTANTGHQHPSLNTVFENYLQMLQELNWTETQISEHINDLLSPYDLQWGDGA